MSLKYRVQKVNRGVMLRIAGITFYPSTEESLELGKLLVAASGGPEASRNRPGNGLETPQKDGPEAHKIAHPEAHSGPEARPITPSSPDGSLATLEAQKGGPEMGPEATERPRGRGPSRSRKPTSEEENERQAALMAGAPVTNRDRP